jgi:hypothetical protein
MALHRLLSPFVLAFSLAACQSNIDDPETTEPGRTYPSELRFEGGFVKKAFVRQGAGYAVLLEPPLSLRVDFGLPRRELRFLDWHGAIQELVGSAPERELLDVAQHPSGAFSAIFASRQGYKLVRLSAAGEVLGETPISDPEIDRDLPALQPGAATGPIGWYSHDTGRVAAHGENLVVATRTGRDSVIAYRFDFGDGGFRMNQRALVMPAIYISPVGLTGGTYDTFGQVEGSHTVHLDVADDGLAYVGVRHPGLGAEQIPEVLKQVFGETVAGEPDSLDVYVVRVSPDGRRLGTSVVSTPEDDEIYGLRALDGRAYVLGRNEHWNQQGTGFEALVARVDAETGAASVREFDVQRGDIAFDVAPAPDGGVLIVGSSDYDQNPHGASISEHSQSFARWVSAEGVPHVVGVENGKRHNEARYVVRLDDDSYLFGGMLDGPGTHSADRDPSLLRASGFLTEVEIEAP